MSLLNLFGIKMRKYEFIIEAKPDNLNPKVLDKLYANYQKQDINDNTIPKFNFGLDIANYIFQFSGPDK